MTESSGTRTEARLPDGTTLAQLERRHGAGFFEGPVKIKDVEAAQQQVIAVIRQLEAEGVLSLRGTVGEQYVV